MRSKKTLIQALLILILVLLNFVVFNFIINLILKNQTDLKNKEIKEKSSEVKNNDLIENLKYTSNNSRGDIYELFADFGEANVDNPDIMFLTNVNGKIKFKNKPDVLLTSNFANFNTKTFETTFIDNVKILRHDEIITGDELYLVLDLDENDLKENSDKEKTY